MQLSYRTGVTIHILYGHISIYGDGIAVLVLMITYV